MSRSPTTALPSGRTTSPVGTASPEAMTFGSPVLLARTGLGRVARAGSGRPTTAGPPPAARLRAGAERPGGDVAVGAAAGQQHARRQGGEQPGRPHASPPSHRAESTCGAGRGARTRAPSVAARGRPAPGPGRDPARAGALAGRSVRSSRRSRRGCAPTGSTRRTGPPTGRGRRRRRCGSRATALAAPPTTASWTALPAAAAGPAAQRRRRDVLRHGCRTASSSATPAVRTRRPRRSGRWRPPSPRSAASPSSCASRTPAGGRSRPTPRSWGRGC